MLHTDMCLLYDIETEFPCCSRIDRLNNVGENPCGDLSDKPCHSYESSSERTAAADAVNLFATGGSNNIGSTNNAPFYEAFEAAWVKATANGWTNLRQLGPNCDLVTPSPTSPPTQNPTASPVTSSPTATCSDVPSFLDNGGRTRDCSWVIQEGQNRCGNFAHLCPVTCEECECLLNKRICSAGGDCCSGDCVDGHCACLVKNTPCTKNEVCCSGICRDDGTCAGGSGSGGLFP